MLAFQNLGAIIRWSDRAMCESSIESARYGAPRTEPAIMQHNRRRPGFMMSHVLLYSLFAIPVAGIGLKAAYC